MTQRIEDYALIGDLATAALVGSDGSIDWFCVPRFDSPACFAALLGNENNGHWQIAPLGGRKVTRRYRGDSLVLETRFETEQGVATVTDCMPVHGRARNKTTIVRLVRCERGPVQMRMDFILRFDYGRTVPWVRRNDFGLTAVCGPNAIDLRTPLKLTSENFRHFVDFTIGEGEEIPFILNYHNSIEPQPGPEDAQVLIKETERWWQKWADGCHCDVHWRDAVVRSLVTLKALSHAATGGIIAAPTTSLPELIGGPRNWDYRFCWLRDATLTLYSLLMSGLSEEAKAWRDWLLRVAAGLPSQLQTIYSVDGDRLLPEAKIDWLSGYEGSTPVRIGNLAHRQLQLDIYGEILDVFSVSRRAGIAETEDSWAVQTALVEYLETGWRKVDNSIWEVRGPRRQFTHSKVMCWVALDRAVRAIEEAGLPGPLEKWKKLRDTIHAEICRRAFNPEKNSFVQFFGGTTLDAALLQMPMLGFLPASDPRIVGTVAAIERELSYGGFIRRYTPAPSIDGLPGVEGVFLPCSFWLADNYLMADRTDEAAALFERLLTLRNDVGLLSEEYDPESRRQLGNFPQAFSHVGLINTAWNLTRHDETTHSHLAVTELAAAEAAADAPSPVVPKT
jgi:GH15 family glucan-1,4-alpha-glucosidase